MRLAETIIGAEYTMMENELFELYDKLIILYEFKMSRKIENIVYDLSENDMQMINIKLLRNIENFEQNCPEVCENLPEIKIKENKSDEVKEEENKILFFLRKRKNLFK